MLHEKANNDKYFDTEKLHMTELTKLMILT
jgi:hypothetical protein